MAKLIECRDEDSENALMDTVRRIRDRSASMFERPLEVDFYFPDYADFSPPADHPFCYVAEVHTAYLLWIIPWRTRRILFAIYRGFYGGAYGERVVHCAVFNRSLMVIVKEEVQKYADMFKATEINLRHNY